MDMGVDSRFDQGLVWLLECLNATLNADPAIRMAAEDALKEASTHQGFGVALVKVTIKKDIPLGLRQLAAVLLKQYVKQHWQEGESYIPPTVSGEDKVLIRNLVLQALDDSHGKIRTAVGMTIAAIANHDWPEEWPELMEFLLRYINEKNDMNKVHGALRCLALLSGDLDDVHLPPLVPVLFPLLYTIVSSPTSYELSMRRRALAILHSCISTLGVMSGVYQAQTKALMLPMLKAWMEQFSCILSSPVSADNSDDWGLKMEVLKSLMQIVENFPKLVFSDFPLVLGPLWQTFVSCLEVYQLASVQEIVESYAELVGTDGCDQSLEAFAIQLFELLITVVGQPRYMKVVEKHITELAYYSIGYMQMTQDQVVSWTSDIDLFVVDESDATYSCRVSGVLLLEELVQTFGIPGIESVVMSVQRRIGEAVQARTRGQTDWWKLGEAALLAAGSVSDSVITAQEERKIKFNLENFLENIFIQNLGSGVVDFPFLHGRILWSASKFSSVINEKRREQFLYAAIEGLAPNIPAPVTVGACQALCALLPMSRIQVLQSQITNVFTSIGNLLPDASDECLHLFLETLQAAIKADECTTAAMESNLSPLLLNLWAQHISNPFVSMEALEVLGDLKNVHGCLLPLASRVLPFLGPILSNPGHQRTELVAGAIDLLTLLLKGSPADVIKAAHDIAFRPVIGIILQSEDHSELQNATECLAAFVREGGEALLTWSTNGDHNMKLLLDAASRLLSPGLDSSSSLFVGSFITELLQKLPGYMAQHLRDLVAALVSRMETAQILGLKNSLILVFARLVHMSAPNVGQLIELLGGLPAKGYENALAYVISEWTKQQGEIQGSYQIKVSTTALAILLASRHPQLANITVQGQLIKSTSGVVTRSRAKILPDQWTSVSLPVKLFSLLADVLAEMQEEKSVEFEDDWEEVEGDDDDNDDEGDDEAERHPSAGTKENGKSVFQPLENVKRLLKDEVEDDYEDDPCAENDPINQINLSAYIAEFMKNLAAGDRCVFNQLWQELSKVQKNAVQAALGAGSLWELQSE